MRHHEAAPIINLSIPLWIQERVKEFLRLLDEIHFQFHYGFKIYPSWIRLVVPFLILSIPLWIQVSTTAAEQLPL